MPLLHPSEIQCRFYRYLCTSDWDRDRWKMEAFFLMNVNDCVFDCIITWCSTQMLLWVWQWPGLAAHNRFCSYKQTNIFANQILTSVAILKVICFALPCRYLEHHPCVKSSQDSPRLPTSTILGESRLNVHCVLWNLIWHIEEFKCVCIFGPRPSVD